MQLLAVIIRCRLFDLRPDLVGAGDDVFFLTGAVAAGCLVIHAAHAPHTGGILRITTTGPGITVRSRLRRISCLFAGF
jgi:hypothetical protein